MLHGEENHFIINKARDFYLNIRKQSEFGTKEKYKRGNVNGRKRKYRKYGDGKTKTFPRYKNSNKVLL